MDENQLTPKQPTQLDDAVEKVVSNSEETIGEATKVVEPIEETVKETVAEPVKEEQTSASKKEKKKKMRTYQQRQDRNGYLFMAPWILGFVIFTLYPFIMTIILSFSAVSSTAWGYKREFIGVKNYINAFVGNQEFLPALLGYLRMIIPYTFIVVVLSFIIAYLLNKINVGKGILRTIYFLPVIIMSGPVMQQLLTAQGKADAASAAATAAKTTTNAYSNIFIMQIIESYSRPLANGLAGIFDQLSVILWFTGIPIVLFINGLQKINPSIYEAAKIDSANAWQIMWKITIPMLKGVGLIITVFTVIQLGMFDSINPMYKLIEEKTGDLSAGLGFAATYAWIYSVIALLIIGIIFLLFKDRTPKDIKARKKQEKKLKKLDKYQKRRLKAQKRHQAKEAKLYGK